MKTDETKINSNDVDIEGVGEQARELQDRADDVETAAIDGSSRDTGMMCAARDNLKETEGKPAEKMTSSNPVQEVTWSEPAQKEKPSKSIQEMTSRPSTSGISLGVSTDDQSRGTGKKHKKTKKVKASSMSDKELRKQLRLKKEKKRRKRKGSKLRDF